MLRLRVRLYDPGVDPALADFAATLDDLSVFYRKWFIPRYLQDVGRNFATEGGLVGGWPELSAGYREWKEKHYPNRDMLILTRRLRRSLSPKGRSKEIILEVTKRQAVVGTKVPYAPFVQAERMFLIPAPMLSSTVYSRLFNQFLEKVAKKSGLRSRSPRAPTPPPPIGRTVSFFDPKSAWTEEHFRRFGGRPQEGRRVDVEPDEDLEADDEDS
jgi:hypothetical protein